MNNREHVERVEVMAEGKGEFLLNSYDRTALKTVLSMTKQNQRTEDAKLKALLATLRLLIETLSELDRVETASRNYEEHL